MDWRPLSVFLFLLLLITLSACSRQPPPAFVEPTMKDVVALRGQDIEFSCKVDEIGRHMVAFVKTGSPPRLIAFNERVFRQMDKYELRPRVGLKSNEWVLSIKNVQESDKGNYSCQINTDPVMARVANLDLRIPPTVSRSTPSAVEVREGHNVTLSCKADGIPPPTVIWRRQDRQIIRYNGANGFGASVFHGPSLHLTRVNRKHMSEYVCVASNGIPPDESWTVKLLVTFEPIVLPKVKAVRAKKGSLARLVCNVESWPRPDLVWEKDGEPLFDNDDFAISQAVSGQYHSVHVLDVKRVGAEHFGRYRCTARNDNGQHFADILLEESDDDSEEPPQSVNSVLSEGSGLSLNEPGDDEDSNEARSISPGTLFPSPSPTVVHRTTVTTGLPANKSDQQPRSSGQDPNSALPREQPNSAMQWPPDAAARALHAGTTLLLLLSVFLVVRWRTL